MKTSTTPYPSIEPKCFASVRDLVKATAADDEQIRAFDERIKSTIVVNTLIRTRAAAGMTQADVAEKMACSQSAVSKLEHASDAELTLQELASYMNATGGRLNLGIGKQLNRVERIKELAICLKSELESLADLSSNSDDPSIRQSINSFFGEAWFNLFKILCDTTSRLPKEAEETSPLMLLGAVSARVTVSEKAKNV